MKLHIALVALCLLAAGCGKKEEEPAAAEAAAEAPADGVKMDAETQAKMGVKVAAPVAAVAAQTLQGFARVMDVGPLAAIESEVSAAEAAAAASSEEHRRLAALAAQDQAASARSVEAAKAQAAADAARVSLATRRIGLEWGPALERMPDGERSRLLTDIAAGRAVLLRIDAPGATAKVTRASVRADRDAASIPVAIIGPAAAADARLQTAGLLGLVRGAAAQTLPTGRLMQADLELGATEEGFALPESALLRAEGSVFVYMKTGPDTFARREVADGRATANGWFVAEGFKPDEQVVVDGAASLLAAEQGPAEVD
jgi:hypothetical protein